MSDEQIHSTPQPDYYAEYLAAIDSYNANRSVENAELMKELSKKAYQQMTIDFTTVEKIMQGFAGSTPQNTEVTAEVWGRIPRQLLGGNRAGNQDYVPLCFRFYREKSTVPLELYEQALVELGPEGTTDAKMLMDIFKGGLKNTLYAQVHSPYAEDPDELSWKPILWRNVSDGEVIVPLISENISLVHKIAENGTQIESTDPLTDPTELLNPLG